MASCYGAVSTTEIVNVTEKLNYLPIKTSLRDGSRVEVDFVRESEHEAVRGLLNHEIEEGLSWPFEEQMDVPAFRAYFLSHAAFVVRALPAAACTPPMPPEGAHAPGGCHEALAGDADRPWGTFYIKPNFPGRCSHFCNGGFITEPSRRRRGVGRLMGLAFLRIARDLGYKASYFNLVFRTNEASLRLWRSLGFTELATVPGVARLKGIAGLVDAIQFYHKLDDVRDEDLPEDVRG